VNVPNRTKERDPTVMSLFFERRQHKTIEKSYFSLASIQSLAWFNDNSWKIGGEKMRLFKRPVGVD